jgi:membrane-associated phospholipid phosphatase
MYDKPAVARAFAPLLAFFLLLGIGSAAALRAQGITLSPEMSQYCTTAAAITAGTLIAGWWLFGARGFTALAMIGTVAAMAPGSMLFSYTAIAASAPFPTIDAKLAAIDAAMGFDWITALAFVGKSPFITSVLEFFYHKTIIGLLYVLLFLWVAGRYDRLIEYFWLFTLCAFAANVISIFLPAAGAFVLHAPGDEIRGAVPASSGVWHLAHFNALRDGTFSVFDPYMAEGLITFPSFHTASAVLIALALRGYGLITAVASVVAALIVASTVPIGGHHLIDVVAGTALVFVLLPLVQWIVAASFRTRQPAKATRLQPAAS